ncbi:hypothetical protein ElyMa_002006700 [Elysia marginata]|uniref:Uncharacterized protein n=1 Tax=Elysia marginata TaxID=1093978 RepID=A0AAV4F4T6_9GAST|nr:hypothetical protein ElyMa_002006700 [Elysia marginata]
MEDFIGTKTDDDIAFETGEELPYDLREALEHFDSITNAESQTKPKIVFNRVKQQLCKTEARMADRRTAKNWLQYLQMLAFSAEVLASGKDGELASAPDDNKGNATISSSLRP